MYETSDSHTHISDLESSCIAKLEKKSLICTFTFHCPAKLVSSDFEFKNPLHFYNWTFYDIITAVFLSLNLKIGYQILNNPFITLFSFFFFCSYYLLTEIGKIILGICTFTHTSVQFNILTLYLYTFMLQI